MVVAARELDNARMIRYVERTGSLHATDLGRTASHFYIKHASVQVNQTYANGSHICLLLGHVTTAGSCDCMLIGHVIKCCWVVFLLQVFNEWMKAHMTDAQILAMVAKSQEFEQIKVCVCVCWTVCGETGR